MINTKKNLIQNITSFFKLLFSPSYSIVEYKSLLQNQLLLKLVIADSISFLGNKITYFALLKKVYEISGGNVVDLGFLTIVQILPYIFLGPVAGVLADRVSRRKILITTDLFNGLTILTLIFIDKLEAIFVVSFVVSCCYTFRIPAQKAFEPNLVANDSVPLLNSFKSFNNSFMYIAGSALGAAVVAFSGISISFVLDSATFFISAVIIASINLNELHIHIPMNNIMQFNMLHINNAFYRIITDIKTGVAIICDSSHLKLLLVLEMSISFLFGSQSMLYYLFIRETMLLGDKAELAWGTVMTSLGIGSIIGSLVIGLLMKSYLNRFKLFINILIFDGVVLIIFSLNTCYPYSILLSLLLGIICPTPVILLNTILQEVVVDQDRGKIFSFFSILGNPMTLLSVFVGTTAAKIITAQGALLLFALLEIAIAFAILFSGTYRYINQKTEDLEPVSATNLSTNQSELEI